VCPHVPIMVIVLLMFTAMSQSFSSSIIGLFINMDMALGPVEVTRYWMYVGYTVWFQPVIGWVADVFVIFGEKRRPLFILALLGNAVIYFVYCFKPSSTTGFTRFVFISIVSEACTMGLYIPLNGLIVEVGRTDSETQEESVARMSAIMSKAMVFRSIGSLAGTVLQTCLVIRLSVRDLLGFTAGLFLLLFPLVVATPHKLFVRPSAQDPIITNCQMKQDSTRVVAPAARDSGRGASVVHWLARARLRCALAAHAELLAPEERSVRAAPSVSAVPSALRRSLPRSALHLIWAAWGSERSADCPPNFTRWRSASGARCVALRERVRDRTVREE